MSDVIFRFLSVLSLVSRIPVRLNKEPDYSRIDFWLPIIGIIPASLFCLVTYVGINVIKSIQVSVILAILCQYLLFNLFHFDGLLDTADASGVFGDSKKKRAVLKDSRIGAYALFAGFIVLALRFFSCFSLFGKNGLFSYAVVLLAPVAGRFASCLVTMATEPYQGGGLGAGLQNLSATKSVLGFALGSIPSAVLCGIVYGPLGTILTVLVGGLSAVSVGFFIGRWYGKNLDGYSGDALGAATEIAEVVILVLGVIVSNY